MEAEWALLLTARLCLGSFFAISAFGKLLNYHRFIIGVRNYQVVSQSLANVIGIMLPWVELCLVIALITGVALPVAGFATSFCLVVFIFAVGINLRRGRAIECNCYGIIPNRTIGPGKIMQNLLLLIFAAFVIIASIHNAPQTPTNEPSLQASPITAVLIVFLTLFSFIVLLLLEGAVDLGDHRLT